MACASSAAKASSSSKTFCSSRHSRTRWRMVSLKLRPILELVVAQSFPAIIIDLRWLIVKVFLEIRLNFILPNVGEVLLEVGSLSHEVGDPDFIVRIRNDAVHGFQCVHERCTR